MSEAATLLHVQAAGRDLLLPVLDLREVTAPLPVAPLPGAPVGIHGVVVHEGEFLPVLRWSDLPGSSGWTGPMAALAVLRPRLGIPLDCLLGTLEAGEQAWSAPPEDDPWNPLMAGLCDVGGRSLPVLDPDRLVALLHRLHGER